MKDNLSIVILMIIFVTLVVIFPLYNFFERQDDMSYNLALRETTTFVEKVLQNGYLDGEMYGEFVENLANTGNLYDIEFEAHIQTITKDPDNINKDVYITQYRIDYTDDIFNEINNPDLNSATLETREIKNGIYKLNIGDQFYVKLKNSNTTMAGALFNSIISTSSKERIVINYGGVVKSTAWNKVDAKYLDIQEYCILHLYKDSEEVNSLIYMKGKSINLSDVAKVKKNNYEFVGWSESQNGQVINTIEMNSDKTLYAVFKEKPYRIYVYDIEGMLKTHETYESSYNFDNLALQYAADGYTLDGFYDYYSGVKYAGDVSITSDLTLEARYNKIEVESYDPIATPTVKNYAIGNKQYTKLQYAIIEATNNQHIRVLNDVVEGNNVILNEDKTVYIDLAGHKLEFEKGGIVNNASGRINIFSGGYSSDFDNRYHTAYLIRSNNGTALSNKANGIISIESHGRISSNSLAIENLGEGEIIINTASIYVDNGECIKNVNGDIYIATSEIYAEKGIAIHNYPKVSNRTANITIVNSEINGNFGKYRDGNYRSDDEYEADYFGDNLRSYSLKYDSTSIKLEYGTLRLSLYEYGESNYKMKERIVQIYEGASTIYGKVEANYENGAKVMFGDITKIYSLNVSPLTGLDKGGCYYSDMEVYQGPFNGYKEVTSEIIEKGYIYIRSGYQICIRGSDIWTCIIENLNETKD